MRMFRDEQRKAIFANIRRKFKRAERTVEKSPVARSALGTGLALGAIRLSRSPIARDLAGTAFEVAKIGAIARVAARPARWAARATMNMSTKRARRLLRRRNTVPVGMLYMTRGVGKKKKVFSRIIAGDVRSPEVIG